MLKTMCLCTVSSPFEKYSQSRIGIFSSSKTVYYFWGFENFVLKVAEKIENRSSLDSLMHEEHSTLPTLR